MKLRWTIDEIPRFPYRIQWQDVFAAIVYAIILVLLLR